MIGLGSDNKVKIFTWYRWKKHFHSFEVRCPTNSPTLPQNAVLSRSPRSGPAIARGFQNKVKIFPWFCENIWSKKTFSLLEVRCPSLRTPLPAGTSPACLLQLLQRSKISWKFFQHLLTTFHHMWNLSNILHQQDFKSFELYARKLANRDIFGKELRIEDALHCTSAYDKFHLCIWQTKQTFSLFPMPWEWIIQGILNYG